MIRLIPSLNNVYGAGADGSIYRMDVSPPRRLRPKLAGSTCLYEYVNPSVMGRPVMRSVHRLVCEAWHGAKPVWADEVRHLDGNPRNNIPGNLDWGTRSQNRLDTVAHGRHNSQRKKKLTDAQVDFIRGAVGSHASIARRFGVSRTLISHIRSGKRRRLAPAVLSVEERR
jgi:hypothetical protein